MESHLIYSASSHMKSKVIWNEWIYCGIGNDIKVNTIIDLINEHFQDSVFYFVSARKQSSEMSKQDAIERIKNELGKNELLLWDTDFKTVIEFNNIGVMRNGFAPTHI